MTPTLGSYFRPVFYGFGSLAIVASSAGAALGHPQPALTIPECAQASLIRSTIDPKKPDAKKKGQQAAQLQTVCEAKMKQVQAHPSPAPQAPPPKAPPPRSSPQPQMQQTGNAPHSSSFFGGMLKFTSSSSTGASPDRSQAPRTYSGPPPSYGTGSGSGAATGPAAAPYTAAPAVPAPAAAPAPASTPAGAVAPTGAFAPAVASTSTTKTGAPATGASASTTPLTPDQLNVFGVQLYQGLNLPACGTGVVDTSGSQAYDDTKPQASASVNATCMQTGSAARPIAQRFADLDGVSLPQKVKFALVRLAPDRCPSWVGGSCTLGVAMQGGIVIGLSFFTRSGQDRVVEQTITSKYKSGPSARDAATCDGSTGPTGSTQPSTNRTWALNDLTVRYRPVGGLTCGQGRVLVDGTPLSKLRDQRVATTAPEPKM